MEHFHISSSTGRDERLCGWDVLSSVKCSTGQTVALLFFLEISHEKVVGEWGRLIALSAERERELRLLMSRNSIHDRPGISVSGSVELMNQRKKILAEISG